MHFFVQCIFALHPAIIKKARFTYFVIGALTVLVSAACNVTRNVPQNHYLLEKNKLVYPDEINFKEDNIRALIRQRTNSRIFKFSLGPIKSKGIPHKLMIYNMVDSTKVADKRYRKNMKLREKNAKRLVKQDSINAKRIRKARERGDSLYKPKYKRLKDTINPRKFLSEKMKYDFGEPPVIFDSLTANVTRRQMALYLQRKGFFNASVEPRFEFDYENRRVTVVYELIPRDPFIVDSMRLRTSNETLRDLYESYLNEGKHARSGGFRFDADLLAQMRNELAEFYRNHSIYAFRSSYIVFEVDTLRGGNSINVDLIIQKRRVANEAGELIRKPFQTTYIRNVNFHFIDTMSYKGNFLQERIKDKGMQWSDFPNFPTLDTLYFDTYRGKNPEYRTASFLYNGTLPLDPEFVEFQNYLEENNVYKGHFVDRSFNSLYQTGQFSSVRPQLIENEDNTIDVNYYLEMARPQSFRIEPRATHTNGFIGILASMNYQHKNIFGGGQRFKFSLSGGLESQADLIQGEVNETSLFGNKIQAFNTLEFGPTMELELPGLYPLPLYRLSKRQIPSTNLSLAANYQTRNDFDRNLFQFNYIWKFTNPNRTQIFNLNLPFLGGIQYVFVNPKGDFQERLEELNDLFVINAFSPQFIWKDLKVFYQYSNQEVRKGKVGFSFSSNFDLAGTLASLMTTNQELLPDDEFKKIFNVRYSQFARLDNDVKLSYDLKGERSIHGRILFGAGLPFGNNAANMPFDYSFFAGGTVDNRGFRARSIGPGAYKYYLDTNRTITEMGDIRIGGSLEYRFRISGKLKGALFSDVGNIWSVNEDINRLGGQFSNNWFRELAVSGGFGFRYDIDFLVIRLDVGIPMRLPSLPSGSQWIFQPRDNLFNEAEAFFGPEYRESLPKRIFQPQLNIAIGYPF
jgi:outer membrane protein insertion porin family